MRLNELVGCKIPGEIRITHVCCSKKKKCSIFWRIMAWNNNCWYWDWNDKENEASSHFVIHLSNAATLVDIDEYDDDTGLENSINNILRAYKEAAIDTQDQCHQEAFPPKSKR